MIGLLQDGVSSGEVDEAVEGCGALWSPNKGHAFLEEVQERVSDVCEPRDEGAMISEDPQRRPHFFNRFQNTGPFSDTCNFAGINAEGFTVKQET